MQRFYKMWTEQLHLFLDTLGAQGKLSTAQGKRQQVSLQADSVSSQYFQKGKQSQDLKQGTARLPVMLIVLVLILWLMYDKLVLLQKPDLLPHASAALSAGLQMLPPLVPNAGILHQSLQPVGSMSNQSLAPLPGVISVNQTAITLV